MEYREKTEQSQLTNAPDVVRQHVTTAGDILKLMQAEVAKEKAKQAERDHIWEVLREAIPKWLLDMPKDGPGFLVATGATHGVAPETIYLSYAEGHGIWRQLPDRPPPDAPVEWAQRVDAENEAVKVNAAPVMHANRAIGSESEQSVSFASLSEDDQRWLFVEIDLAEDTATAKFSESADVPTDDPHTGKIRWRLSKWKRTATGVSLVRSAWPGGVINIPSVYGPRTW